MKEIRIGRRSVGGNSPCYIIAEIGGNHNGSIALAKKIIKAAKKAGADAVKFQAYRAQGLVGRENAKAFKGFKKIELGKRQLRQLKKFAAKSRIEFFASAFDIESADVLHRVGVPCFKIASGELTNIPLLKHIAKKRKPIMLSTGLATAAEIGEAVRAIYSAGNRKLILLHCVADYPAHASKLNLRKIQELRKKFRVPVGFSDHSLGTVAAIAAAALGAKVVEKHFTVDKKLPGPDQKLSADPGELKQIVEGVRQAEKALGSGGMAVAEDKKRRVLFRKGLWAAKDIGKGEKISAGKIVLRRPAVGILPKDFESVLGKRAKVKIKAGEAVTWAKVQK